jgi:predicted phage terminase large subunit-like protein
MADRIQRAVKLIRNSPYVPAAIQPSPPQWAFIASNELEVLYAGAVGGGKSVGLLCAALMYAHVPGYSALLIRKNFPDLAQPGGLMHMANEWLGNTDAHRSEGGKVWTFPSGATLRFGHIESPQDWIRYQGGEYQFIGIDELPTLEYEIWDNLSSRLRRSTSMHPELASVPDRIRGTGNPGGKHAKWVKEYFISDENGVKVNEPDRLFLPSMMTDNPHLDAVAYRKILDKLDPLRRAQMRDGNWDILPTGTMFASENFLIAEGKMTEPAHRIRAWDLAGSGNKSSDYCAGVLMARSKETGLYRVEHVVHGKWEPGPLEQIMRQTAELDGKNVAIVVEEERSGSGKLVVSNLRRNVLKGFQVRGMRPSGDKVARAGLFSALVDRQELSLAKAPWNEKLVIEATSFPQVAHDDMVDATSMACHALSLLPCKNKSGSSEEAYSSLESLQLVEKDPGGGGVPVTPGGGMSNAAVRFLVSGPGKRLSGKRSPFERGSGRRRIGE